MSTPNDSRPTTDDTVVSQEPPEYDFSTLELPGSQLTLEEDKEEVTTTKYAPAKDTFDRQVYRRVQPNRNSPEYKVYRFHADTYSQLTKLGFSTDLNNPTTQEQLRKEGLDVNNMHQAAFLQGLYNLERKRNIEKVTQQNIVRQRALQEEAQRIGTTPPNQTQTFRDTGQSQYRMKGDARTAGGTQGELGEGVTGQRYRVGTYRRGEQKVINTTDDPYVYYSTLYRLQSPRQRELMDEVDPAKLEESNEHISGLDYGLSWLSSPQSVFHIAAAQFATVLPNPDDEGFLGGIPGSVLQTWAGYMGTNQYPSLTKAQQEEMQKLEFDIAKNLYASIATGKVYDNYTSNYEGTLLDELPLVGHIPRARGTETFDAILPIEDAQNYVNRAKELGVSPKALGGSVEVLADPIGREIAGLAMELVFDPLWLIAPAKGARTVNVGGDAMSIGSEGMKVVDALAESQKIGQQEAMEIFVRAIVLAEPEAQVKLRNALEASDAVAKTTQKNISKIDATLKSSDNMLILNEAAIESQKNLDKLNETIKAGETLGRSISAERTINAQKSLEKTAKTFKQSASKKPNAKSVEDARNYLRTARYAEEATLAQANKVRSGIQMGVNALDDAKEIRKINSGRSYTSSAISHPSFQNMQISLRATQPTAAQALNVKRAGKFAFHFPLTSKTHYVSDYINPASYLAGTVKIKPVQGVDTLVSISAKSNINVTDLQRLNGITTKTGRVIPKTVDELETMVRNGEKIVVGFGPKGILATPLAVVQSMPGIRNASTFRKVVAAKMAAGEQLTKSENFVAALSIKGRQVFNMPFKLVDIFFSFVGSNMYQPFMANREFKKAIKYYEMRGVKADKIHQFMGAKGKYLVYLQRANGKMWEQYNQAIKNHQQAIINGQDQILTTISRLHEAAEEIAKTRNDKAAAAGKKVKYTGQSIIDEAARHREMGVNPTEEMVQIARVLESVIQTVKNTTGKEAEQVRQALQNIARFAAGDPNTAAHIKKQLDDISRQLDDTFDAAMEGKYTLENFPMPQYVGDKPTSVSKVVDEIRTAKDNVRKSQEFLEKGGRADAIKADVKLKRETLAEQIKNLKDQKDYTTPDIIKIQDTLDDVNLLRRELRATLSQQVKYLHGLQKEFLEVIPKLVAKNKQEAIKASKKTKSKVVKGKTREDFKADKDLIRTQRTLKRDIPEAIRKSIETQKELEVALKALKADADFIKKTLLPEARKAAKEKKLEMLEASDKALKQSVKSGQKKQFNDLMTDLNKKEKAIRNALDNFDRLSQNPNSRLFNRGNRTDARVKAELEKAYRLVKAKKAQIAELMGDYNMIEPKLIVSRFSAKPGDDYVRALQDWEVDLWNRYNKAIEPIMLQEDGYYKVMQAMLLLFKRDKRMTPEDFRKLRKKYTGTDLRGAPEASKTITPEQTQRLQDLNRSLKITQSQQRILARADAAGTASASDIQRLNTLNKKIDDTQESINKLEAIRDQDALYPSVIGERFADVPPDIEPIIAELDVLLESYQLLWKKHGYNLVKDPADIIRQFGVASHVPHLRANTDAAGNPVMLGDMWGKTTKGDVDDVMTSSLNPDAAKTRTLLGTIEEINALRQANGTEDWLFVMDPQRLHASLLGATKSMAGKELFVTLIRTGAIRGFKSREEAITSGYVPFLNRRLDQANAEYLQRGDLNQLRNAQGENISPEEFDEILRKLLEYRGDDYLENLDRSMIQDIRAFKNAANIEQVVGAIRAAQHKIINQKFDDFFGDTSKVIDIKDRHVEVAQTLRAEQNQKYLDQLDLLANKKQTDRIVERQAKMKERLDEGSDIYQREQKGLERKAWTMVAEELNTMATQLRNRSREDFNEDIMGIVAGAQNIFKPLSGTELKMFYGDQPVMGMYIQESIANGLSSYFESLKPIEGGFGADLYQIIAKTGDWWKTNVTVAFLAYHTRNFVGNEITNLVDVGTGALNLRTRADALHLSVLIDMYSKYGSLDKAYDAHRAVLANPDKLRKRVIDIIGDTKDLVTDTTKALPKKVQPAIQKINSKTEASVRAAIEYNMRQIDKARKSRIDLGDGIPRSYDDALDMMQQRGVISGNADYRIEIDAAQTVLHEATLSLAGKETKAKKLAKSLLGKSQDALIVGASMLGTGFVPIAMTRGMGQTLARRTENQVRAANFMANLKKGRSIDDSTARVEKYFFNYQDITPMQRRWIKHLFPFSTWRIKNVQLHIDMFKSHPQYLALVSRMFNEFMPVVDQSILENRQVSIEEARREKFERDKKLPPYSRYRLKIPGTFLPGVPMVFDDNGKPITAYDAVGLGLPIEDFTMQVLQPLREFRVGPEEGTSTPFDTTENIMAQTHVLFKGFYMLMMQRDPFYRTGVDDPRIRRAEDLGMAIATLKKIDPVFGIAFHQQLANLYEYNEYEKVGKPGETQALVTDKFTLVDGPGAMRVAGEVFPPMVAVERALREAAALNGLVQSGDMDINTVDNLPQYMYYLQALYALKLKQRPDEEAMDYFYNQRLLDAIKTKTDNVGITTNDGKVK